MNLKTFFKASILLGVAVVGLIGVGGCMTGCAGHSNSAVRGQYNMILTEDVPLLESGPQQMTPPSATLRQGTRVRILSASGAFAYIETVRGQTGFVPMHSIQPKNEH